MLKKDQAPIIVVVTKDRYDCLTPNPVTPRSTRLFAILQGMNGISDSVPPGTYHFNVKRKGFKLVASLYPIE